MFFLYISICNVKLVFLRLTAMPPKGAGAYSMAIFHKIFMLLFLFFKKTPSKFQLINRGALKTIVQIKSKDHPAMTAGGWINLKNGGDGGS